LLGYESITLAEPGSRERWLTDAPAELFERQPSAGSHQTESRSHRPRSDVHLATKEVPMADPIHIQCSQWKRNAAGKIVLSDMLEDGEEWVFNPVSDSPGHN
jgi:hypothetical protein